MYVFVITYIFTQTLSNTVKKKTKKEIIKKIKLIFGKKGRERNINSSYEWLPHPLIYTLLS